MTRRSWATLLTAAPLVAQVSSAAQSSQTAAPPASDKAADSIRKVSERLAQTDVPMNVEPAFSFHP